MSGQEVCDVCGSTDIREIKCKVICGNCGTILKSCADLISRQESHLSRNRRLPL
jgi:rubredoxin